MIHPAKILKHIEGELIMEKSDYLDNGILSDDEGDLFLKLPGIEYLRWKPLLHLLNQCSFHHGSTNQGA